jgi:hypothetical protein
VPRPGRGLACSDDAGAQELGLHMSKRARLGDRKMRLTLCKLCEFETTLHNGNEALIGLFDSVTVNKFPCPIPPLVVAAELEYEPSEAGRTAAVEVVLLDQDGRRLVTASTDVPLAQTLSAMPGRVWVRVRFGFGEPVEIARPGIYRFDVLVNGNHMASERLILEEAAAVD